MSLFVYCTNSYSKQISDFDYEVNGKQISIDQKWKLRSKVGSISQYSQANQSSAIEQSKLIVKSFSKDLAVEGLLGIESSNGSINKLELLRFSEADHSPESLTKCNLGECYTITRNYCAGLVKTFPASVVNQIKSCLNLESTWEKFLSQKTVQEDLISAQRKDLQLAKVIDRTLTDAPLKHLEVSANIFYLSNTLEECRSTMKPREVVGKGGRTVEGAK